MQAKLFSSLSSPSKTPIRRPVSIISTQLTCAIYLEDPCLDFSCYAVVSRYRYPLTRIVDE